MTGIKALPTVHLNDDLTVSRVPAFNTRPVGQYLFLRTDGVTELWKLTTSGWFDAGGVHYDSPLKRMVGVYRWKRVQW